MRLAPIVSMPEVLAPIVSMPEVLAPLGVDAEGLTWSILDVGEIVTWDELHLDVGELERRVFASPTGLHFSLEQLREFARRTRQVIDGLFVVCSGAGQLPDRHASDEAILTQAEMVVSAFDSTWWLISAPDHVLRRVGSCFPGMDEADGKTPLRAWGRTPE